MSGEDRSVLDAFIAEMKAEFPRFRIVKKSESSLSRAIDVALKILTVGQMDSYMTVFHTVIGDTLYVPAGWDDVDPIAAVITLRHERIHLRQRRRYTMPGMTILYLLLPFPVLFAYGRARLEWEAYTETLRATLELRGEEALRSSDMRDRIISRFTGPSYLWMWPFRETLERWYDEAVEDIAQGH